MIKAVVGANWGDEGKGKITDMLAREADIIVRFQEVPMQDIPSSMTMASLRCIPCRQVCFMITPPVLSAMALH